jgi:hypothetical protein
MHPYNFFDLFKKKSFLASSIEKTKIVMEIKVSCNTNFQIQFPLKDNQSIIKEFYGNSWNQEVELVNPETAYIKIFITKPIGIKQDSFVTLKLHHVQKNESIERVFTLEEDVTVAKWFKINWDNSSKIELDHETPSF